MCFFVMVPETTRMYSSCHSFSLTAVCLSAHFPITVAAGRAAFADWFLAKGVVECRAWPVLSAAQMDRLLLLEPPATADALPVARFLLSTWALRSEEHTSELQSLMRISYAVFCLQKKNKQSYLQN